MIEELARQPLNVAWCGWDAIWLISWAVLGTCALLVVGQLLEAWLGVEDADDEDQGDEELEL
jgi:hypothetical protein